MAQNYWISLLNRMMLEIIRDERLQERLLSLQTRESVLTRFGFSDAALRILMAIQADSVTQFVKIADERLNLSIATLPALETLSTVQATSTSLVLRQRGFSDVFAAQFERILTQRIGSPTKDLFVLRFSEETPIEEIPNLINILDEIYKAVGRAIEPSRFATFVDREARILRPREFKYGSFEVFIDLVDSVAPFVTNPAIYAIVSGVMVNALYDITKSSIRGGFNFVRARLKQVPEKEDEVEFIDDYEATDSDPRLERARSRLSDNKNTEEFIEKIKEQKHIIIGSVKVLAWGTERETEVYRR